MSRVPIRMMHKSLKPTTNVFLILAYAAALIGSFAIPASPSRWAIIGAGAFLGVIAGTLQLWAMEEQKTLFLAADSALAVRDAMKASRAGRAAIYTLWAAVMILVLIAFVQKEGLLIRMLTGYAAFSLVRDIIALKGCLKLQGTSRAKRD